MRKTLNLSVLFALLLAGSAQAQSVRDILYSSDGPLVRGMTYCHQALGRQDTMDDLAASYGFQTPRNQFGQVETLDRPREGRRAWRLTYTGSTIGSPVVADPNALTMYIRVRDIECEIEILGAPLIEEQNFVPVTYQVLEQLDPTLVPRPTFVFDPILVAGVGPGWHGDLRLQSDIFSARVSHDTRISPYVGARWEIKMNRRDIISERY